MDILETLLQFEWRGITFPVSNIQVSDSHDLAIHKYPNVDGARVEEMGRNPRTITATCAFINGLVPSSTEHWNPNTLYPSTYNKFLSAMADGTTGILVHPALGRIVCKAVATEPHLNANIRGGEIITAQWIETIDENLLNLIRISGVNLLSDGISAASQIDNLKAAIPTALNIVPAGLSFSDLMSQLQAFPDQGNLYLMKKLAFIKSISYQVNALLNSVNRLINTTATLLNPQTYQAELLKIVKGHYNIYTNAVQNAKTVKEGTTSFGKNFTVAPPNKSDLLAQYNAYKTNPQSLTPVQLDSLKKAIQGTSINPNTNILTDREQQATTLLNSRIKAVLENQSNQQILSQITVYANQLLAALQLIFNNINIQVTQATATYTTTDLITMTSLSIQLNNSVEDLMTLNPQLTFFPYVAAQTNVKYFI